MSKSAESIFAMLDPAHLTDGLFKPTARSGETLIDVEGFREDEPIKFEGAQLAVPHHSILLAILARTARQPKDESLIHPGDHCGMHDKQMDLLAVTGSASRQAISVLKCTPYALLLDAGMGTSSKEYVLLSKLLGELASVTIHRGNGSNATSSRLISFQHNDNQFTIGINWRLSGSISRRQNSPVSLVERRSLGNDPVTKILHAWLCSFIRLGGSLMAEKGAEIDTLIRHVWGKPLPSKDVMKKRRVRIKQAIKKINTLPGWETSIKNTHVYVRRTKQL
jgi:hypothetical protein